MKRRRCIFAGLILVFLSAFEAYPEEALRAPATASPRWAGQFLVASRRLAEPPFAQSVIYLVAHTDGGAMGLMVNRVLGTASLKKLVSAFGIRSRSRRSIDVYFGGPVELGRGFVLHSGDYAGISTQKLSGSLSLSTGLDVMQAMADGRGPKRQRLLFGYAGWGPGQLDAELARGDWMLAPADESLIFSKDSRTVWQRALAHAGIPL